MPKSACCSARHRRGAGARRRRRRAACRGCRRRARTSPATSSRSTDGRERPEGLAVLDLQVQHLLHASGERASPRIERPPSARGPNSMRPWNQPTRLAVRERARTSRRSARSSEQRREARARGARGAARMSAGLEARAEIATAHRVARAVRLARLAEVHVVGGERRAERAAGVARRRLDPDALEGAVAQQLAVGDAVERDAAGEAEVLLAGLAARARARCAARPPRSPPGSRRRGPSRAA